MTFSTYDTLFVKATLSTLCAILFIGKATLLTLYGTLFVGESYSFNSICHSVCRRKLLFQLYMSFCL
uniref:Uncharacterized protein n=1 Tax=Arundo donax TaxID=35708 RepID=A0A0A9ESX4_ARUDO